ncbi:MAG TPA: AMP-binding protein [Methanomassiliicoccales archaeon]|nr:AMP-binding protein [Methanomassiliicoccales archaeon]
MSRVVLVTGATGFLGTEAISRLLEDDCVVAALVRARDKEEAELRLRRAWWDFPELRQAVGKNVKVITGDVKNERICAASDDRDWLVKNVTHILHTAADIRLNGPQEELDATNVKGTLNLLRLAEEVQKDHGLERFAHVSTAYVAGKRSGRVEEDALDENAPVQNNYERSKLRGETEVRRFMDRLPITILRPGMVVGDSRTGRVRVFNTIYYPLRLHVTGHFRFAPISSKLKVNLVPVDEVASPIVKLMFHPDAKGKTFHIVAPDDKLPTIGELAEGSRKWAKAALGVDLPRPIFMRFPDSMASRLMNAGAKGEAANLSLLIPYFSDNRQFSRDNVDRLLGPYSLDWREFLPKLLDYAAYTGFLHRSGRTVHEQVLFRLGRQNRKISCCDIVEGKVVEIASEGLRKDMLRAASALRRLGVSKGDSVAIVGWNSTRYLTIDVAIGLVGAVSVPLYYTSPPADITELVQASGAKVLFIGTDELVRRSGEIGCCAKLISFCRTSPEKDGITSWQDFLSSGKEDDIDLAPVGPDDVATIRYTSSTTGKAKGVTFCHRQLLYMAESMVSLFPWEARHRPVRYLSYLPMNHVVEGLLATYAPYYAPTSVDIFFLEDFKGLRNALPVVRPIIFFSVPRFYEKLWDQIHSSTRGEKAMRPSSGGFSRGLVGRTALKRAGLDDCVQLIVGSGPMGIDILKDLSRLGIEVHNAYGLTEAPLVTLNRQGRNRIGSVGEPLPYTEVLTAEDGEVLVKGPQVTIGYRDFDGPQPFRDGWLLTGDLGRVENGHLFLEGRKKELIKTSYGKFVSPMRVESMLRDSPLVSEAIVIGEGRPYCVALLWPEGKWDAGMAGKIDAMVEDVNSRLSQPERARRWAIVRGELSVEGGELTANMKLRRRVVEERFASLISTMYASIGDHQDAWHIGWEEEQ